jgi:hypothetical protein
MVDRPPTRASYWLGAFVVWQVVYLVGANLTQPLPRSRRPERGDYVVDVQVEGQFTSVRPVQGGLNLAGAAFDRWSELTGQQQNFKMFCPELPKWSLVPVVVMTDATGTNRRIDSSFVDFEASIRPPQLFAREHHREVNAIALVWHLTPDIIDGQPERVARDYPALARYRIRTATSFIERIVRTARASGFVTLQADLNLKFATKPPEVRSFDERPFLRFQFDTNDGFAHRLAAVELYSPTTKTFEAFTP